MGHIPRPRLFHGWDFLRSVYVPNMKFITSPVRKTWTATLTVKMVVRVCYGSHKVISNVTIPQPIRTSYWTLKETIIALHRFRDTERDLSKCADPPNPPLALPFGWTPVAFRPCSWHQITAVSGLLCGVVHVIQYLTVLPRDAVSVRPSVRHKSEFYWNGWTNRARFWHVSFLPPVLYCVKRKFGYLQNKSTSLWNFVLNSGLKKISPRHIDRRNALST